MLDSVLFARDKWLKKDGFLFPQTARMYLTAFSDDEGDIFHSLQFKLLLTKALSVYESRVEFWKDIYGWDYSPIM